MRELNKKTNTLKITYRKVKQIIKKTNKYTKKQTCDIRINKFAGAKCPKRYDHPFVSEWKLWREHIHISAKISRPG